MTKLFTSIRSLGILAILTSGTAFAACLPPNDDAGNDAGTAAVIPSTGFNAVRTLEHRSDQDFFVFTAIPYATYTFTVTEVSAPDLDVCIRAGDGSYILQRKNSAAGNNVTFSYSVPGGSAGGQTFVDVRSLGEAMAGTYRLNVTANLGPDNDNDSLPDQWEVGPWGNGALNTLASTGAGGLDGWQHDKDGDGFSNWQELQMGTDPTVFGSSLIILDIEKQTAYDGSPNAFQAEKAEVQWPAVKNGYYEVSYRTNDVSTDWRNDNNWTVIDSMLYTGNSGDIWTDDVDGVPPIYKIYRVQQFGISPAP